MAQELKCRNCGQGIIKVEGTLLWNHYDPSRDDEEMINTSRAMGCWGHAQPAEVSEPKPLTMAQALEAFKQMFPERAGDLNVERVQRIGDSPINDFYLWHRSKSGSMEILAQSHRSFEHALAIAKSGNEDCWPEDRSEIEETV